MCADENSVILALACHGYFKCASFGTAFSARTFDRPKRRGAQLGVIDTFDRHITPIQTGILGGNPNIIHFRFQFQPKSLAAFILLFPPFLKILTEFIFHFLEQFGGGLPF